MTSASRSSAALVMAALLVGACSSSVADTTTSSSSQPVSTSAPATTAATTTTMLPAAPAGPIDPLPVIPVGPDGVEYQGGEEMETFGPHVLAVGRDGSIHVIDPLANRILSFGPAGESSIDLTSIDIAAASWIAAASDHLVVVEIFFAPVRHRVHRVSFDGTVLATFELPLGGRLEDGLSGVLVDDQDRIVLVAEGGARFLVLDDASFAYSESNGVTSHGTTIIHDGLNSFEIGGSPVSPDLTGEVGGMGLVGIAADGTVVLTRDDVISMDPITVVETVEWYSPAGEFLGSAPVDLDAQAIDWPPGLAVAPDGTVVALYALADRVEAVELVRSPERLG